MKPFWRPAFFVLVLPLTAAAQTPESDTEARLRALEEQVKALQAEVAALKQAGVTAAAPTVAPPAAPAPAPPPKTPAALAAAPHGRRAAAGRTVAGPRRWQARRR